MNTQITLDKNMVRLLTEKSLRLAITEFKETGKGSFVLPDLIGSRWDLEYMPFYDLYANDKVAGQEMGKLLSKIAADLKLTNRKENKRGKKDAITRYFF